MKKTLSKTIFVTAAFVILFCCSSFVNKDYNSATSLKGIWELFVNNRPTGFLKILATDGKLTNIAMTNSGFVETLKGTYEIQSDSVYIEKIEKSVDHTLNGINNKMVYKMDNENTLTIMFFVNGHSLTETYHRIPAALRL